MKVCVWWGLQGSYGKCLQLQLQLILSNNTVTEGKRGAARDKTVTARDKTGTTRDKTRTTRDKTGTAKQTF